MKWKVVREQFPNKLVLVEVLTAHSERNIRTIEEMSILSDFTDSMMAWQEYKKLHKNNPNKELYIFHTSKERAEVIEKFFTGIRGLQ